jgi:two-component system, sensor histidine kinase PdtaS
MLQKLRDLHGWPVWIRLALTACVLVAAHLFQIPLETEVPGEPFLLFFLIVIGATLLFGEGTGLFAAGFSTFLSFFFFEPYGTMALLHAHDLVQVELYGLLAVASVLGFARLARAFIAAQEATEISEKSAQSKSLLLSELAHRVANNFATTAAFIHAKANSISDVQAKAVLNEAIGQVNMMARVHRRLQSGGEATSIDSESFIRELCRDLNDSMARGRPLTIDGLAVSRLLPMAQAIPLGLIVNELVTNAVKYAFPNSRPGKVLVGLEEGDGCLRLTVEDDGVGMGKRAAGVGGSGQHLVRALAEQLNGHVDHRSTDRGSVFWVVFPAVGATCASASLPAAPATVH